MKVLATALKKSMSLNATFADPRVVGNIIKQPDIFLPALTHKYGARLVQYRAFASNSTSKKPEHGEVFGSPTYDNTFRMLCDDKHPNVLISILNNFLHLKGDQVITSLSFPNQKESDGHELTPLSPVLANDTRFAVDSTIDVLCKTKGGKQIAIEMQRAQKSYFLSRTQLYMSKLIASQVEAGQSEKAHEVMLDTYIICIGVENIFTDSVIKKAQSQKLLTDQPHLSFESTVTPRIHELDITVQDNKMTWKFFELTKFKEYLKRYPVDGNSEIRDQWMHFLLKCQEATETPEEADEAIKEAYEIMRKANWTPLQKVQYDMEINGERLAQTMLAESKAEGEAKGRAEGEEKSIKKALHYQEPDGDIINEHNTLTPEKLDMIKALPQPPGLDAITQILLDTGNNTDENVEIAGEQFGSTPSDLVE